MRGRGAILGGIGLLWFLGIFGLYATVAGDCFPTSAVDDHCLEVGQRFNEAGRFLMAFLAATTVVGLAGVLAQARILVAGLLVLAGLMVAFGLATLFLSGTGLPHPIGGGFLLLLPASAFLANAAVWALRGPRSEGGRGPA